MSEKIKIETVKDSRGWQSDDGKIKNTYYTLDIQRNGTTQEVDHARQQGKPAPQPGEELEVIFEPGKYREKMKKAPQSGGPGGGKGWKPREPRSQYDPEDMARQTRSAAQDRALKAIAFLDEEASTPVDLKKLIEDWTKWFEDSVLEAGQAALQGTGAASSAGAPPVPEQQPATFEEEHRLYTQMLETAALDPYPAEKLSKWALENLNPASVKESQRELSDIETQQAGVNRLKKAYEKQQGPLPDEDPDLDSVPF